MKISFDYYTKDGEAAVKAYTMTVQATTGEGCSADLRYDAEDDLHNIMGTLDHKNIDELFALFESGGFSDDRYSFEG